MWRKRHLFYNHTIEQEKTEVYLYIKNWGKREREHKERKDRNKTTNMQGHI